LTTQLPAGLKFCKITQNRPRKKVGDREKSAAVRPPIFAKKGRKAAEKFFVQKLCKNHDILSEIFKSRDKNFVVLLEKNIFKNVENAHF